MNIVLIGTGNTATILGRKFKAAGHTILQIFGRDAQAASELAYELDSESTNYWSVLTKEADLYFLAVNDMAIEEVVNELNFSRKILVHTAAAVSKDVFKDKAQHYGVFYPLQSLLKENARQTEIPILIDASDENTMHQLEILAGSISNSVVKVKEKDRLKLHLAAVFCNNFTNHLYTLVQKYCQEEGLDFSLLLPLIEETAARLKAGSPADQQTGPAIRKDDATLKKHLRLLKGYPHLKSIYELFTESIQHHY